MKSFTLISVCLLAILLMGIAGCSKGKSDSGGSSPAVSPSSKTVDLDIKEHILMKITVDSDSYRWPVIRMPEYKKRMPGVPQHTSRFAFVVRNKEMRVVTQRPVYDDEFAKGRTLDFHVPYGSYSVALETVTPMEGHNVQFTNRVFFDFEKVEPALLAGTDLTRLRVPEGLSRFWRSYNTELVPVDKADEVLKRADEFEAMDVHKGYYNLAVPMIKVKVAIAYCRDGKPEKALEVLEQVKAKGYLLVNLLRSSHLDPIRDTERFKSIQHVADTETDPEAIGPWTVVKKPFCSVEDLLSIETNPPLPTADSLKGQPVMIITGDPYNQRFLETLAEKHQPIISIAASKPMKAIEGVDVYVADVPPRALMIDGTAMLWVADAAGHVIYNQRQDKFNNEADPVNVIEYLKLKQPAN